MLLAPGRIFSYHADQELDDELRDRLERETEEYVAKGMGTPGKRGGGRRSSSNIGKGKDS